jgi:predicted nucleic acid-binding protein
MKMVLMDTAGLLSLWEEMDQWHQAAERAMANLLLVRTRLITTLPILLECGNAASRKPYRPDVYALRRQLIAENRLIVPTDSDIDQAWNDYQSGNAGDAGIVDHISFSVMRRLRITDVFTNDKHFLIAGFRTLY